MRRWQREREREKGGAFQKNFGEKSEPTLPFALKHIGDSSEKQSKWQQIPDSPTSRPAIKRR